MKIHKEQERGHGNFGWLRANYSFSFSNYYNPAKMGFKSLRVINEDFIAPQGGFPPHGHQNMEILTVVLKGKLGHTDSMGNVKTLSPGRIQRMYAGSGVRHSEFNIDKQEELNLLQIWIQPHTFDKPPEYQEKEFDFQKDFILLASNSGRDGSIRIYQDVEVFLLNLNSEVQIDIQAGQSLYLHNISGETIVNQQSLSYGDSLTKEDPGILTLSSKEASQVIGFKFLK